LSVPTKPPHLSGGTWLSVPTKPPHLSGGGADCLMRSCGALALFHIPSSANQPPKPNPTPTPNSKRLPLTLTLTLTLTLQADPYEQNDLAAANPDVVAELMAKLQQYNNTHCNGQRCNTTASVGPKGTPQNTTAPGAQGRLVWTPWRGDPDPANCDTNITDPVYGDLGIRRGSALEDALAFHTCYSLEALSFVCAHQ
jgi:hypothetical protein